MSKDENITNEDATNVAPRDIVRNIFSLRSNFLIIGLTGRTGSGCTTVAKILSEPDFDSLKSKYKVREACGIIDNDARKNRIVYNYIKENWEPFIVITMSDMIYYYALQLSFEKIIDCIVNEKFINVGKVSDKADRDDFKKRIESSLNKLKDEFDNFNSRLIELDNYLENRLYRNVDDTDETINKIEDYSDLILKRLPEFRKRIEQELSAIDRELVPGLLQNWGDNIRRYKSIVKGNEKLDGPEALAKVVNRFIKLIRQKNKLLADRDKTVIPTRIVIDALRNPFEILYFRERWSGFYCLSVNTPKNVRHDKLMKYRNLSYNEVKAIDEKEKAKSHEDESFRRIDIDRCLQLSDVHLSHKGEPVSENFKLVNQLFTYLSLMLHPGLVPPSPQERLMQIAYTAKLNSGCLSRQVGAAITDEHYSLRAIGWNSAPAGQVPCALREFNNLAEKMDQDAFSDYERHNDHFNLRALKS